MKDELLHRICSKIQVVEGQRQLAEERYKDVGEWLGGDPNLYFGSDIVIYPQGSLNIGTTVKPLSGQEFDLDIVSEFEGKWQDNDSEDLLLAVYQRMQEYDPEAEVNKPTVDLKNRCVRLTYTNEFHMDILPAVPAGYNNDDCLKVPDRDRKCWKDSNPKGFAKWFEEQAAKSAPQILMEKAEIEPFPVDETVDFKPPLKRAVQLMKRFRDVYFSESPSDAPISIVLTTLAGRHYKGEVSIIDAIANILVAIHENIPKNGDRLKVLNPKNDLEDLSEKWDTEPHKYQLFLRFINDFLDAWTELNAQQGIQNFANRLKAMFGESVTEIALTEQATFIDGLRKKELLGVSNRSGKMVAIAGGTATTVRGNTFYGSN